jgi:NADH dehydrogenase/NADH:ubiquinone oxidoreductase subunit G
MNNQQKSDKLRSIIKIIMGIGSSALSLWLPRSLISESEITDIASDVVVEFIGKRFLGLTKEEQDDVRKRAQAASQYLTEASKVLTELQDTLNKRSKELDLLMNEIDAKRTEAEHWQEMATVNEELAQALTKEIEKRVQKQIRAELDRNKTKRQIVAAIMWIVTLIAGGVVGVIFQQWATTSNLLK